MYDLQDYAQRYAEQYRSDSFELHLIAVRRQQVLSSLSKYRHDNILEVGCGLEPVFAHFEDYRKCTIVEACGDFAEHARRLASGKANIVIHQGLLEDCGRAQLKEEAFDFIILSSLLHEVPNPARLLQAVRGLCGPQSVVHINVPNVFSFHRLLALEMGLISSIYDASETEITFQRHTRFDKQSLIRIVEENGFRVLSFGSYFIKPFSNSQMQGLLKHKIVDGRILLGLERMTKYLPEMGCEMFVEAQRA
jgi:SAM-dependent methyltransferase